MICLWHRPDRYAPWTPFDDFRDAEEAEQLVKRNKRLTGSFLALPIGTRPESENASEVATFIVARPHAPPPRKKQQPPEAASGIREVVWRG